MNDQRLGFRHPQVQRLRRLLRDRSEREKAGAFVVEGAKLLAEALSSGTAVHCVFVAPRTAPEVVQAAAGAGAAVCRLAPGVIERVATTVTPQPVMAVVGTTATALEAVATASLLVVAVEVQDPGNLGTLLRTAAAAGADAVVCCGGHADIYNPKSVRASAGSIFHIPVVAGGDPLQVLDAIGTWGLRRLATAPGGGDHYGDIDLTGRVAFVVGNEGHGLTDHVRGGVDGVLTIPMAPRAESLNVAVATGVLCFEAARQRRRAGR